MVKIRFWEYIAVGFLGFATVTVPSCEKPIDQTSYLIAANECIIAGQFDSAKTTLEKLVSTNPSDTAAHTLLGMVYESIDKFDDAVEQYKCGGKCGAIALAYSYITRDQLDKAQEVLEKAQRIETKTEGVSIKYGLHISPRGRPWSMEASVDDAIKATLIKIHYYKNRNYEKARQGFIEIFRTDTKDLFEAFISPGGFYVEMRISKDLKPKPKKPEEPVSIGI